MPSPIRIVTASSFMLLAVASACSSSSSSSPSSPPASDELTFSTIEPILQERCQRCHREGGIAPFPLVSYADIKGVGGIAKQKISAREMPPWGAFDDDACKTRFGWRDDLRMTDDEIRKVVSWIDKGMPEGDPSKRPPPKTFEARGLEGKTHTLAMKAPFDVPAGGKDDIRCFPIDPGFTEDTWIGGVNVVPGDPRVVHHVLVFVDPNRDSIKNAGDAGSYPCFGGLKVTGVPTLLLGWAPGVPPTTYGDDVGLKVAKSSMLVMQVHYHPYSQTAHDQTAFELKVLPTKPSFVATMLLLGNASSANGTIKLLPGPDDPPTGPEFKVPANAKHHTESMEIVIPDTIRGISIPPSGIVGVGAHMHLAGVDMKIEIERQAPTDRQPAKECLLGTPKYDFNWQRGYAYATELDSLPALQAGDKLRLTCTYDNTMDNRNVARAVREAQMSGPQELHLGESTFDEMCLGAIVTVRRASAID
jgi:hypothetical protein